ncbi:MAG TPA: hypothetical protein VFG04_30295 [Planctomycetaceae bacterium]|nr:hypothetical protein [Planctomycetaceae bacterium]
MSAFNVMAADSKPLSLVPGSCNAVAIVKMRALVNSPLGKRGKWFDEARRAYAEGLLSGPPWVKEIVQATTVGSMTSGQPLTYSLYVMDQPSVIGDIAKHELAPLEKLAGHAAVASPRNVYFIQLATGLVGAVQPANRQVAANWARSLGEKQSSPLAPDLVEALNTQDGAQVTIVVDLKDMLNPQYIVRWFVGSPKLRATDDIEGVAKLLSSLKTARLSIQVTDTIVARLQLDFDFPVGKHASAIEKAVAQWLDDVGGRPRVIAAAKTKVAGNTLTFEMPLDEVGLRRVLTLVQSPHISPKEAANPENRAPNALASAAYYNKVCDLLNSLLHKNRDATEYEKTALWHEQYARRIAGLSTVAVDPALVRWGRDVSKELVALAQSLHGELIQLDQLERSIRVDETTTYQWYGFSSSGPLYFPTWVTTNDNVDQVRSQQESQSDKAASQREQIWNMLYQETTDVARAMESKYQIKLKLPK